MKHEDEILGGEILVLGKDGVQIELGKGIIVSVLVEFKNDNNHNHPCNPHHDKLEWEIHDRHHGFVLLIKWDVSSAREIIWAVDIAK